MMIQKLSLCDFSKYKNSIYELLKEAIECNFQGNLPSESYYDKTIESLKQYLSEDRAIVFVLLDGEKLIGWAWCHSIERFNKKRLHISNIAAKPEIQNKGYGSELINEIRRYAKSNEYDGIDLLVTAENHTAVRFYGKTGFMIERHLMKMDF